MPEGIFIALIGFIGAILGALIAGVLPLLSTAGKIPISWSALLLSATIGAAGGLVLGIIIAASQASPTSNASTPASPNIESIVGTWSGTWSAQTLGEGVTMPIRISVQKPCDIGSVCGVLEMPSFPCSYKLTLASVNQTGFVFSKDVQEGVCSTTTAKDTLQPLSDGTLLWIASTGKANGVLRKAK